MIRRLLTAIAVTAFCGSLAFAADPIDLKNTTCPVKGNPAKPTVTEVYKGMAVHFCCTNCAAKFKAEPEKYVTALRADPAVAKRMDDVLAGTPTAPAAPAGTLKLDGWPEAAKTAATATSEKYGAPKTTEDARLVWEDAKPFKRIVVHREGTPLEQVVAYKASSADELAKFSEHVKYDGDASELSARHDREELNVLALNLANDIATGTKTLEQATTAWTEGEKAIKDGQAPAAAQRLSFEPAK